MEGYEESDDYGEKKGRPTTAFFLLPSSGRFMQMLNCLYIRVFLQIAANPTIKAVFY